MGFIHFWILKMEKSLVFLTKIACFIRINWRHHFWIFIAEKSFLSIFGLFRKFLHFFYIIYTFSWCFLSISASFYILIISISLLLITCIAGNCILWFFISSCAINFLRLKVRNFREASVDYLRWDYSCCESWDRRWFFIDLIRSSMFSFRCLFLGVEKMSVGTLLWYYFLCIAV